MTPRTAIVIAKKILSPLAARKALTNQLRYLAREAAGQDGQPSSFFDATAENVDTKAFLGRSEADAGHYRLVVSPDECRDLDAVIPFTRQFVSKVESALGSSTDWIATAHYDTGRPHVHILLKAVTVDGDRLRLSRSFLNSGLREAACEAANEVLGPRIEKFASRTIKADRFTELDCVIIDSAQDGIVLASKIADPFRADAIRRLIHLEQRGWVGPCGVNEWTVPSDLRQILRTVAQNDARDVAALRVLSNSDWRDDRFRLEAVALHPGTRVVGAYVGVNRTGPYAAGSQAVVLDSTDGRLAHLLIREAKLTLCLDRVRPGAIIEINAVARRSRAIDEAIAEVAERRGGIWSAAAHTELRPTDWSRFVNFHMKRAQAMSVEGVCTSVGDGRFAIPSNYCHGALEADIRLWGPSDIQLRVLDDRPLDEQVRAVGFTWLDRLLTTDRPEFTGPFGAAVKSALAEREKRLRMTGIGSGGPFSLSDEDVHRLRVFEVKSVFEPLEQTGKPVFLVIDGQKATGQYVGRVHISGLPYAVLEAKSAYHLVGWKPGMESCRGRYMDAVQLDGSVEFRTVRSMSRSMSLD